MVLVLHGSHKSLSKLSGGLAAVKGTTEQAERPILQALSETTTHFECKVWQCGIIKYHTKAPRVAGKGAQTLSG